MATSSVIKKKSNEQVPTETPRKSTELCESSGRTERAGWMGELDS